MCECLLQRLHTLLGNVLPSPAAVVPYPRRAREAEYPVEWQSSTCMGVLLCCSNRASDAEAERSGRDAARHGVMAHEKYQPSSRAHGGEIVNILYTTHSTLRRNLPCLPTREASRHHRRRRRRRAVIKWPTLWGMVHVSVCASLDEGIRGPTRMSPYKYDCEQQQKKNTSW